MVNIKVDKTASRGIAVAPAYKYQEIELSPDTYIPGSVEEETEKFYQARDEVMETLKKLSADNEIFAAHMEIAGDFMLQEGVISKLQSGRQNVQQAFQDTIEEIAAIFTGMDDAYMKERGADVKDIGKQIMARLKGTTLPDLGNMDREYIVVAKDLYPSDTVKMDTRWVKES